MVSATKFNLGCDGQGGATEFTCASGVEILKNKVLTLSDPFTVAEVNAASNPLGYVCAGIAAMDKDSTDGSTKLTVWTDGIFKVYASGNITVGQPIKSYGTGYFGVAYAADVASGVICGRALETAATGETFLAALETI